MTAPTHLPTSFTFPAGPMHAVVPDGTDVDAVLADVADDSVSAPAEDVDALREVVARAQQKSVDLAIVVVEKDPPLDAQLRDLATVVGTRTDGTVLVLSPGAVGSFSPSIDRVTLEAGQDLTYTGNPVVSANNFLDEITAPGPPWTGYTIVILAVVVALIATMGVTASRRWRRAASASPDGTNDANSASARAVDPASTE